MPMRSTIEKVVATTLASDLHTHLFTPEFGPQIHLWGIDELVTYHYLVAEQFRFCSLKPEQFWAMTKEQQADHIWKLLFVERAPLSEACRGVVNVLKAFGLNTSAPDLKEAREFFRAQEPHRHIENVLKLAGLSEVVMTNDAFDPNEVAVWEGGVARHPEYHAALRIDPLLNDPKVGEKIAADAGGGDVVKAGRNFLDRWIERMKPLYMAVSLPPTFQYPEDSMRGRLLRDVIFPTAKAHNIPFAMMIGVRKRVNPALVDAGDSLGHSDTSAVERICLENPDNRFLVTMLSRENQHELCVAARKFSNLMIFGCWWFLNNPSIMREITAERIELLGASTIPQHSDARILEQLIYKWAHTRRMMVDVLDEAYSALAADGRIATEKEIQQDVAQMFHGNFQTWVAPKRAGSAA
jgi:hypothetical protein